MDVELRPGDQVETPDGPGVVRNVVRTGGEVTTILVELEQGEKLVDYEMRPWRGYMTNDLRPVNPRLV